MSQGSIPPPYTHIKDIKFLKPGHLLEINTKTNVVSERCYWKHPFQKPWEKGGFSEEEEGAQRLESAIRKSFKRRLRSDVPVGAFLSGGIDSTYVCSRLLQAGASALHTFTVGIPGQRGDESIYAREISKRLGTTHHEVMIDLENDKDWLSQALEDMDVPSINGPNTWLVSRAVAREGFKVACSGVGGDELFYGYPSFALAEKTSWFTHPFSAFCLNPFAKLLASILRGKMPDPKFYRIIDAGRRGFTVASLWLAKRAIFSEKEIFAFLSEILLAGVEEDGNYERVRTLTNPLPERSLREVSTLEQRVYLHDQLLRDTDAMSMANSLEVRLPLISKDIIETIAKVSPSWLWKNGPKWVLKDWLSQNGFANFFDRPKQGFTLNWSTILPAHLKNNPPKWNSIAFDVDRVNKELDFFLSGKHHHSRVFTLLSLQNKAG